MDAKMQSLPPLKRFARLRQQHLDENKENNGAFALHLPAKKRKESREPLLPLHPAATSFAPPSSYCLPAKKRIWAPPPESVPGITFPPFDLNLEYRPPLGDSIFGFGSNQEDDLNLEYKPPLRDSIFGFGSNQEDDLNLEYKPPLRNSIFGFGSNQEDELVENCELANGESNKEEIEDGILCAVCQSTDGDPLDPIVFCDGCDLMVHATCYGNPLVYGIPEGEWYCAQCVCSRSSDATENGFSCCLCNREGGALKRTTNENGSWAHLVCALYVPEVFFEDPDGREGINCSKVPKRRREGKCYLCKRREGCVIECSEMKCKLAFHVTCGLSKDLCFEYKEGKKKKDAIVAGFCKTHSEIWEKQQHTGKFKIVARD